MSISGAKGRSAPRPSPSVTAPTDATSPAPLEAVRLAREQKARDQAETDAIARAVLEALSAHDL